MKGHRQRDVIEREVARHRGVSLKWEPRGRHVAAVLSIGPRSRFVLMSMTCSDHRALQNQIADVRRTIRTLREAC